MKFPNTYDTIEYIMSHSSEASRYEQLAEEAVELAHAAQKIARYLRGEQAVADDFDLEQTKENVLEEYVDTSLAFDALVGFGDELQKKMNDHYDTKADRWVERLMDKNKNKEKENG